MNPVILIVDDEAGVRSALSGVLSDEGYDLEAVASGEACLDRLARGPADVIILDIWLPGMDGLATLARLQGAYELDLDRRLDLADLVEEERAAVSQLELPSPVRDGAGERALDVAEQLAFDQLLWNRGTVHLHEWAVTPAAHRMDRACDQLLARAVLPVDEHAPVGGRGHRDLLPELRHQVALTHHGEPLVHRGAQRAVFRLQLALAQRVTNDEHGLIQRQRLLDEVEGPHLDRADRRFDVAVARDHDDFGLRRGLFDTAEQFDAVDIGHPDVEQHQARALLGDEVHHRPRAARVHDPEPFVA